MKTIIHVTDLSTSQEAVFEAFSTVDGLARWWTTEISGKPFQPSGVASEQGV